MLVLGLAACGWRTPEPATPPPVHRRPEGALQRAPDGVPDLTVDCNGTGDHTSIQDAIDAAADRSWIEVLPCDYDERIDFGGKTLWISSTGGPSVTTIDARHDGPVVQAENGEGDGTALVGFTLEDGDGEAVDVELSALRLQEIVFDDSEGSYTIRSRSGDLELVDVTIDDTNEGNVAQVWADKGAVLARGLTVTCGNGDGLFLGHNGFIVDRATVTCTGFGAGQAIEDEHAVGRLMRSTITGDIDILAEETHPDDIVRIWNTAVAGDVTAEFGTLSIRNAVVDGQVHLTTVSDTVTIENTAFTSALCAIDSDSVLGPIRNNDFSGGPSQCNGPDLVGTDGNVALAPMFVDPLNGDLHLQAGSPLIDAGVAESAYEDVDGTRNDIGVYGGRYSQDGGW